MVERDQKAPVVTQLVARLTCYTVCDISEYNPIANSCLYHALKPPLKTPGALLQ